MDPSLADRREDYRSRGMSRSELDEDPFVQFRRWFDEWLSLDPFDATAMALATAAPDGRPSLRFVLLKGVDHGFCFFSSYESRKGIELAANPQASLCFAWIDVQRQVRVSGAVERMTAAEADEYFASRPRDSQIGAWASNQSRPIESRADLEQRFADASAHFGDGAVPRPETWGGFRLLPDEFEFWQGRTSRLHDRIQYARSGQRWERRRLMP